ncbi:MAG TPA: hypothetical protein PK129_00365 [Cellvibrionaceae bacterium]|nr:hypothetical protein [Cellvibrionaceae bacterium]
MLRLYTIIFTLFTLVACQTANLKQSHQDNTALNDHKKLVQQFSSMGYTNPDRNLVALMHVCTLDIARHQYPVIDLRELVKSPNSPRGVNRIFILNEKLEKVTSLDYTKSRPLLCKRNKLHLSDQLQLDNFPESGNTITLDEHGTVITLETIESSAWL